MLRKNLIALALVAAVSATFVGCSDDSSPTGPDHVGTKQDLVTRVTVTNVQCIKDGDGVGGRGDFWFYRQVGGSGRGWSATLSTGERSTVNWTKTMRQRDYQGEGHAFEVTFQATEYDQDILGNVYPDSDMDGRTRTASYVSSPDLQETNYITLGNDRCKVRMHYKIVSELVDAED